jgi:hypothetical protein
MEIKGTAITAIRDYVKSNHPEKFSEWLNALPEASKDIYSGVIDSSRWYPLNEGGILPTRKTVDMFFDGDYKRGAWEAGKFSAEEGLTGIYKLFVKAASPGYIIQRASRVFASYYQPCKMEVLERTDSTVLVEISDMTQTDIVIEYRIAGWIEKALQISGAKNVVIDFKKSITRGDSVTQFAIKWD